MTKNSSKLHDYDLFVRLLNKHESSTRAFIRASLPFSQDVCDVMQEVSIIAWNKFSDLDDPELAFPRWISVIAKYEILKFRRGKARDRVVLNDELLNKIQDEGIQASEERQSQLTYLKSCVDSLSEKNKNLVTKAYTPEVSIKDLAAEQGKKPDAVYQYLRRIRLQLGHCIEKKMELA